MDLPKQGLLTELVRKGLTKKWEERYFDLTNGMLKAYVSESNQELKGSVAIDGAQVFRPAATENDREFVLNILPAREEHMYVIACASEEECKEWFEALTAHAKSIVVLQGPLLKCDSGFKKWNQRHFVLTKKSLMYFKSAEAKIPQAEIDLQAGGDIIPDATVPGQRFAFSVTPKDLDKNGKRRTYILVAPSDQDRDLWIASLRSVLPTVVSRFTAASTRARSNEPSLGLPHSGSSPNITALEAVTDTTTPTVPASFSPHSASTLSPLTSSPPTTPTSPADAALRRSGSGLPSASFPSSSPSHSASASQSFPASSSSFSSPSPRKGRSNSIVMFATNIATRIAAKSQLGKASGTLTPKKMEPPPQAPPSPMTVVGFDSSDDEEAPVAKQKSVSITMEAKKDVTALSEGMGVIAQGILEKRSPKKTLLGMHIWKHRLVTLDRDSKGVHIKYYKPEQPTKPLGVIPHRLVLSVDILDAELQRFDIVTQKRTFHLRGVEEGDMDLWVGWLKQLQITSAEKTMSVTERTEEANEYKTRRSHLPVTRVLHEGFLAKKSPKGLGMWQKRFFVLTEARLAYYKTQDTTLAPLGMILLTTLEQVTVMNEDQGMFCLEYGAGRRMVLTIVKPSAVDRVVEGGWNASQKLQEQLNLWLNAITNARSITVKKENPDTPQPAEEVVFEDEGEDDPAQKTDMVRFRVAQELLATERSYIKQLECALEVYMKPMAEVGLLNDRTKAALFSNLPTILPLNRIFLESVENRVQLNVWKHNPKIGDIFLEFAPFFKLYSEYARSNQAASELLGQLLSTNSKFLKYHDTQIGSEKPSLASLLITPIQRVPRYQLLLKEILKNTPREHDDRADCEKALAAVTTLTASVNACIKERELADLAVSLESKFTTSPGFVDPSRFFIMQGPLTKFSRNDKSTLYEFFLFNDMLAYASLRADGKFKLKHKLMINEAFGVDAGLPTELTFSVKSQEKTFKVSAPDENKKKHWVNALEDRANGVKAKKRSANDPVVSNGAAKVRPLWRNNEDCRCCRKKFNLLLHRYHCAACGWSVCAKCSPTRQNDERCCNRCAAGHAPEGVALEGFGSQDVPSAEPSKNSSVVVDEGSDDDGLSGSDEEAGWVNPFAVFAARTEDLEEKARLSASQNGLELPELKRTKSKSNLASSPKKPLEAAVTKDSNRKDSAPLAPGALSLTYFAYTNSPRTFEHANGSYSNQSVQAELAALTEAKLGSAEPTTGLGSSTSSAFSSSQSAASSAVSSTLTEISIQLPPSALMQDLLRVQEPVSASSAPAPAPHVPPPAPAPPAPTPLGQESPAQESPAPAPAPPVAPAPLVQESSAQESTEPIDLPLQDPATTSFAIEIVAPSSVQDAILLPLEEVFAALPPPPTPD